MTIVMFLHLAAVLCLKIFGADCGLYIVKQFDHNVTRRIYFSSSASTTKCHKQKFSI